MGLGNGVTLEHRDSDALTLGTTSDAFGEGDSEAVPSALDVGAKEEDAPGDSAADALSTLLVSAEGDRPDGEGGALSEWAAALPEGLAVAHADTSALIEPPKAVGEAATEPQELALAICVTELSVVRDEVAVCVGVRVTSEDLDADGLPLGERLSDADEHAERVRCAVEDALGDGLALRDTCGERDADEHADSVADTVALRVADEQALKLPVADEVLLSVEDTVVEMLARCGVTHALAVALEHAAFESVVLLDALMVHVAEADSVASALCDRTDDAQALLDWALKA